MDKEIKDILKDIKETLSNSIVGKLDNLFNEGLKQPCEISIKKDSKGVAKTQISGSRIAILITLAGLENGILKELNCDDGEFNFIKKSIGAEKGKENE